VENKALRVRLDLKAQLDLRAILAQPVMQGCRGLVALKVIRVKLDPRATRVTPESKALKVFKATPDHVA
jgi:hypothetical protein